MGAVLSIGIGEGPAEMHQALDLCREFNGRPNVPRLYASAGIYPHNTTEATMPRSPSSTPCWLGARSDRLRRNRP